MVFVDGDRFEIREPEKPKDPPKGDISGKWKLNYTTPEGPEESTVDLAMEKEGTVTGTVTGKRGTYSIFSGYASADKFSFTINLAVEGEPADAVFSGTFDASSLKGTIHVVSYSIDFTGTKPKQAASSAAQSFGGAQ